VGRTKAGRLGVEQCGVPIFPFGFKPIVAEANVIDLGRASQNPRVRRLMSLNVAALRRVLRAART
jgi:hypothetical protein